MYSTCVSIMVDYESIHYHNHCLLHYITVLIKSQHLSLLKPAMYRIVIISHVPPPASSLLHLPHLSSTCLISPPPASSLLHLPHLSSTCLISPPPVSSLHLSHLSSSDLHLPHLSSTCLSSPPPVSSLLHLSHLSSPCLSSPL